jgi:2-C-methyl-D-erythritol 4-phosphate cytidylyltransferase
VNIAVIFAGGTGQRMNTKTKPKQFLELHGKPILVYTLEQFEQHKEIDAIVLVMLENWIAYTNQLIDKYRLHKVKTVVPGGASGQESIFRGLNEAHRLSGASLDTIVLIHDGVRPLVDEDTITDNINGVKKKGSAITVSPAIETITMKNDEGAIGQIIDRSRCQLAKAPQSFYLTDILTNHQKAREEHLEFIDSASLMQHYGCVLYPVEGKAENIKITTPGDYYIFRAIADARENSQIFGL